MVQGRKGVQILCALLGLGHFAPWLMITTPRPLLPKRGTYPSPNLSPHGERLKKFFAETAEKFYVLVSRDTRWVFIAAALNNIGPESTGAKGTEPPRPFWLMVHG